jgi:uncharacterized membrane protein YoaK (UPF0700 family)
MLRNYLNYRSLSDNIKLGALTAFSAGMVNVISVIVFFAFTSNVTGHYAILAQEIARGHWYEAAVVFLWIFLFFSGNFVSNLLIIHSKGKQGRFLAHSTPLMLEIICLTGVGFYLEYFYTNSLKETESLVAIMLFAMGLQNGLTASITNFSVKTTHLTGLTTDLGLIFSMLTKKENWGDSQLIDRAKLLLSIVFAYMAGGILAGILYYQFQTATFFMVSGVLCFILVYDAFMLIKEHRRLKHIGYRVDVKLT